ncbi:MAG: hypothetical protein ACEQSD_08150, partial [Flavobacteriales bacterium]
MDMMFVLGVAVALILIAFGIYLFFFSRKSGDQAAAEAALLDVPDVVVAGRPPVVPRAARGLSPDTAADALPEYSGAADDEQDQLMTAEADLF